MAGSPVLLRLPRVRQLALRFDTLILGLAVLILVYLTVIPLALLILGSLSSTGAVFSGQLTVHHFQRVLGDSAALELLGTSLAYSAGAALLAFVVGTAMAWIVERTDVPARNLWYGLTLVPLIVPGIIHAIAWVFLLSPEIGWLNAPLRALFGASVSVYSLPGMSWVEGLHTAPFAFVLMSAALRSMDPALEEAAATAAGSPWSTLRRVTLPLMLPTSASILLILFVRALESFEVPAIIGLPGGVFVYTSRIFLSLQQFPPNFGLAAAYAVALLGLSIAGLLAHHWATRRSERFATVTGKAFRPRRLELGRFRILAALLLATYAVLAVGLPFLVLLWSSFLSFYSVPTLASLGSLTLANYRFVWEDGLTRLATFNSLVLGIATATVVMALTSLIGWITVKSRLRGRQLLDHLAFLPITIPGIVLGISLIWLYFTLPLRIYGTLWILLIAYVTRFLPYGIRTTTSGLVQIHRELEEAAHVAGAAWWRTFTRVTLPLLRPAIVAGWIFVFIVSIRELSSGILLYSSQSVVLAIRIFDMRDAGQYTSIAALSVMMMVLLVVLVTILQRLGGHAVRESR